MSQINVELGKLMRNCLECRKLRHERSEAIERDISIRTKSDATFAELLHVNRIELLHHIDHIRSLLALT
jgi:hypothetical protein